MGVGVLGLLEVMGMGVGVIQGCLAPQGGACKTDWHGLALVLGPTSKGMAWEPLWKGDWNWKNPWGFKLGFRV